jgi:hypothetical protein
LLSRWASKRDPLSRHYVIGVVVIKVSRSDPLRVGQGMIQATDNGNTWSDGVPVDPSASDPGHQFFSDVDAYGGHLVAVWQDNRTDDAYSVQLPLGNMLDTQVRHIQRHRRRRDL